jgi:hypothetical protein
MATADAVMQSYPSSAQPFGATDPTTGRIVLRFGLQELLIAYDSPRLARLTHAAPIFSVALTTHKCRAVKFSLERQPCHRSGWARPATPMPRSQCMSLAYAHSLTEQSGCCRF